MTSNEREAVYEAVVNLVRARLRKASNVWRCDFTLRLSPGRSVHLAKQ
jgi:hypothetical protein